MRRGGCFGAALVLAIALTQPAAAAPGDLDRTFAGDGRLAVPGVGPFVARAVATDRADRIVVAGYLCENGADATCLDDGDTNVRLARFTADGGLDPEFGAGGVVTTPMGDGRSQAQDVLVQPDGKLVVAGSARAGGRDVFALARYFADGALDPGFGSGGIALLPIGPSHAAIGDAAPGPNGTIVVAGQAVDAAGVSRMAVARVTAAGALDPAFGTAGVTLGGTAGYGYALGLAVTPSGGLLAAGVAGDSADAGTFRFAELGASAGGGFVRSAEQHVGSASSFANALALTPDGGFLAAGSATDDQGRTMMGTVRGGLAGGRVRTRVLSLGTSSVANDVLTDPNGGAWLVGQISLDGGYGFATARLDTAGDLVQATAITWTAYPLARATAGALQRSGRLVTVGIGCADGTTVTCRDGTPVLLLARQRGGRYAPAVSVPRTVTRSALRRGIPVTVRLPDPARLDVRLLAHGRVLSRVRAAKRGRTVTVRLRAEVARGPLRVVVRVGHRSVTRRVLLRR